MLGKPADQEKQHRAVDHRHLEIENEEVVFLFQRELKRVFGVGDVSIRTSTSPPALRALFAAARRRHPPSENASTRLAQQAINHE